MSVIILIHHYTLELLRAMLSGTISVMDSDYNIDFGTELYVVVTDFARPRQPLQGITSCIVNPC